jgi:hypothetical protein
MLCFENKELRIEYVFETSVKYAILLRILMALKYIYLYKSYLKIASELCQSIEFK